MRVADTITSYVEHSGPRTRKPGRGKARDTVQLGEWAHQLLAESAYAMTLRQLYYRLVGRGLIAKDVSAYRKLAVTMKTLREEGVVPWDWLVDHTRVVMQSRTWDSVEGLLHDSAELYRRDLMRSQPIAIQLWAESDSIGSVIAPAANRYTIPTFIGRGFSARGYLWNAARDAVAAEKAGKLVNILHVGDYDPSGENIHSDVEDTLRLYSLAVSWNVPVVTARREMEDEARRLGYDRKDRAAWRYVLGRETDWIDFERLAVTPEQIEAYQLPSQPPKASDPRIKRFEGAGTVEVEALPVDVLLGIVDEAIEERIDHEQLAREKQIEHGEREQMKLIAGAPVEKLIEAAS